jgi:SPP1 family predicted phage head-tail adaptor
MIPASALNKKIVFQEKSTTKDAGGVSASQWADCITVWANKYVRNGSMRDGEHSSRLQEDVEWKIRYRDDLKDTMRIKYKTQYYRIEFIDEMGDKDGLRIVTNVIKQGV